MSVEIITRDERTTEIYNLAIELGLWMPKIELKGSCRSGNWPNERWFECGEVYSDFWHVKVFDDGTYQLGWLEFRNGTTLVVKPVKTMEEVKEFVKKQH